MANAALHAAAATTLPADADLRDALRAFDDAQPAAAVAALKKAIATDAANAPAAAVIARLNGEDAMAARFLAQPPTPGWRLLAGDAALRAGDAPAAQRHFEAALVGLTRPADRRYALERLTAAARVGGSLGKLADAWFADPKLPLERMPSLVAVARELGRVPELLAWWSKQSPEAVADPSVLRGILAAAVADGRANDALAVCRHASAARPGDAEWIRATIVVLIDTARADEADQLLDRRLKAAKDESEVAALARLAASLGRDAAALRAAGVLAGFGPSAAIDSDLLIATVQQRRGDLPAASAALRHAASLARTRPERIVDVAAALEAAELPADSIDLLTVTVRQGGGEGLTLRLANLLVQQRRPGEALPLLDRLRRTAATPAMREQAARQFVDAAASARTLPAVVERIEKGGPADAADVTLLVDAYRRLKRPADAEKLLQATPLLAEADRLRQLFVFHSRGKAFDKADATLRRLLVIDPEHAADTWRQIASTAAAREKPQEIEAAIGELRKLLPAGPESDETLAGLLSQLDRPADAAAAYASALAARPDNTDDWLLWASAMNKSGQRAAAVERLARLTREAKTPALFAAAADALLNLNAPPGVLREVRREAVLRVARAPEQPLGYAVVADLCDELRDIAGGTRIGELSVVLGSDTRPQALRELMEAAVGRHQTDVAVAAGRTLLALGDEFPPQLFLDLGEQLLLAGREKEAAGAFVRAIESADESLMVPKVADLLARYGYAAQARQQLAVLIRRQPFDADVLTRLAVQDQVCADTTAAFDHYFAALAIRLRELAAVQSTAGDSIAAGLMPDALPYATELNGAIETATNVERQERLVRLLKSQFAAAMQKETPKEAMSLSHAIRRTAFVLGRFDLADDADDAVLRRWPDRSFADTALAARWDYGAYESVRAFAARHAMADRLPSLLKAGPTTRPAPQPALAAADVAAWLPWLAARGDSDGVTALLSADTGVVTDAAAVMPARVAAAGAIGDAAAVEREVFAWLDLVVAKPAATRPSPRAAMVLGQAGARFYKPSPPDAQWQRALTTAWAVLPKDRRGELATRAVAIARKQSEAGNAGLLTDALQIAAAANALPSDAAALARHSMNRRGGAADVSTLLRVLPPADRAAFVRDALQTIEPQRRLAALRECAAVVDDADSAAELVSQFDAIQGPQMIGLGSSVDASAVPAVNLAIGRALQRSASNEADVEAYLGAASAFLAGKDADAADRAARLAFAALVFEPLPGPNSDPDNPGAPAEAAALARVRQAAAAVRAMSPAAVREMLNQLPPAPEDWQAVCRSRLLDAAGEPAQALNGLRQASAKFPDRMAVQMALLLRLEADGRSAEIVERFLPLLSASGPKTRSTVTRALVDVGRLNDAWHVSSSGGPASPVPDISTPAAAGNFARAAEALRTLLRRLRDNDNPTTLRPLTPSPGGLVGRQSGESSEKADTNGFTGLPQWPGAFEDLAAAMASMPVSSGRSDAGVYWTSKLLLAAADSPERRDALLKSIDAKATAGTLLKSDRILLQQLARAGGRGWTPRLAEALWDATIADSSTDVYRAIAAVTAERDARQSAAAGAWADWADRVGLSPTRDLSQAPPPRGVTPLTRQLDLGTTKWIESALAKGPNAAAAIEADLAGVPDKGASPLWVRLAAERGDLDAFEARLAAWISSEHANEAEPDFADVLPPRLMGAVVRDGLLGRAEAVLSRAHAAAPTRPQWLCGAASLGAWAHAQHAVDEANGLCDLGSAWAKTVSPCQAFLWQADLLRLLGRPGADDIEHRLREAGCLSPVTRRH